MRKKRGLIVSRQVGSARAFLGWIAESDTLKHFDLDVFCFPASQSVFADCALNVNNIDNFNVPTCTYDFIITGTSLAAEEDSKYFAWAKNNQIPAIAFVDQWINYAERFTLTELPEYIFAVDERAKIELLKFTASTPVKVKIVGTPALNYIQSFWEKFTYAPVHGLICFVTEPTSDEYFRTHGLSDTESLASLISYLETHPPEYKITLLLHPTDSKDRWKRFENKIEFSTETKEILFTKAQFIIGMRSFILIESSLLQIPTISIQIGRKTVSQLTDNRNGIDVVTSIDKLRLSLKTEKADLSLTENSWTNTILEILRA